MNVPFTPYGVFAVAPATEVSYQSLQSLVGMYRGHTPGRVSNVNICVGASRSYPFVVIHCLIWYAAT